MSLLFLMSSALGRAKAEARAELIRAALERDLGMDVVTEVASSYGDLEDQCNLGKAKLVWAPAGVTAKLANARAVFTVVREGQTSYCSAIVTRRNASFTLANLGGTRAAWVDPLSAGGYLLAMAKLRAEGIDPARTFASQFFYGSHRAAVEAVLHETADITAVSTYGKDANKLAERLRWYAGPAGAKLSPLAFTESCLNDSIVIPQSVSPAEAAELTRKLVPKDKSAIARSRFLAALEADTIVPMALAEYHRLAPLLVQAGGDDRITMSPPSGQRSSRTSWH